MKFEKFVKNCGSHGAIATLANGDKWLVCDGVGMKVPAGVVNLLGVGAVPDKTRRIVEALAGADTDDRVALVDAYLPKDGKVKDIVRVYGKSEKVPLVYVRNADYALMESKDTTLAFVEVEDADDELETVDYLLICDECEEVIGFITSIEHLY